jgi:predicted nucleic acid-binding protein
MKLGLKNKDALHVACALRGKCDYFLTTDRGILNKKIDGIAVMNPLDFVRGLGA